MAKPLVVSIPHSLGKEEALRRLRPGLTQFTVTLPILKVEEETWVGDQMSFRASALGQSASGTLAVAEDHVRFEVLLPWLLQQFAETVQIAINARGRVLLEDKSRRA